ncbi:MAG: hypothetical protein ABIS14_13030 [Sphingomonas sp.]
MPRLPNRSAARSPAAIWAAILLVMAFQLAAYWPGIMTWDAVRQYREALHGHYDDWHPPAMDWLWRQFHPVHKGPAPMLALQLALYWGGVAGLATWASRFGRCRLATALAASAMLPIPLALMGAVLKDCLMAGALMAATAMLALLPQQGWRVRAPALALLVAAATLRFNALPACLPLMIALLPSTWWRTPTRFAASLILSAAVLGAAMPVANRLLQAEPSGVGLSLVIFDLAGITDHSGVDVFPDIDVQNRVAVNARCYSPVKWDYYAFWSPTPCPIQFEDIQDAFTDSGESPYVHWINAITAHPVAYAEHRLAHFNINTRFLVHQVEPAGQIIDAPNPWHYRVVANTARNTIESLAWWTGDTPLGWPIWWMALALGALILAPICSSRRIIVPVALSALLYGLGYLPASVAEELRYHLWTMLGAGIAALIAVDDLLLGGSVSRTRLVCAALPVAAVTLLCCAWRLG